MDHPLVWQSILLALCIASAFAAILFIAAAFRTGYYVAKIAMKDAIKRHRVRRYVA